MPLDASFSENVGSVEFMYPLLLAHARWSYVADSDLCYCVPCLGRAL